jgi:hypothetical protein
MGKTVEPFGIGDILKTKVKKRLLFIPTIEASIICQPVSLKMTFLKNVLGIGRSFNSTVFVTLEILT